MIHIDLRIPPESKNVGQMWIIPTTMRFDEEKSWELNKISALSVLSDSINITSGQLFAST